MRGTFWLLGLAACLGWGCGDGADGSDGTTASSSAAGGSGGQGGAGGGQAGAGGVLASGGAGGAGGSAVGTNRVFVTSQKYTGALGGLSGADGRCQTLADGAALGGSWMAWLGDGVDGPATRFVPTTEPYRLVGGEVIAQDWPDLIDGTLQVPINHDESGTPLPTDDDMIVWTAVFHTGGNPTPVNCLGWTDESNDIVPTGLASATDTGWTVTAPYPCSGMHRLYCFEQ